MWNNRFRWNQNNDQEKKNDLMRVIHNSLSVKYDNIEDQMDMAELFIELLSKNQHVKKESIIEGLCKRWDFDFIMMGDLAKEPTTQKMNITSEVPKPLQASGIRATDKYKKKDENTVKEVCDLLSEGKNYSEIARKLHIDRRTVKKIAVKNGFTNE